MSASGQLALQFPVRDEFVFSTFLLEEVNRHLFEHLESLDLEGQGCLYLWGARASGKTHLLQSLCHKHNDAVYLPLKNLLGYSSEVLQGFEQYPLVCIDDVQLLAGKPEWEEALFSLFNSMRDSNKIFIASADVPLASLDLNLPDLHSRFSWGLTFQVHELSESGKRQVLKSKAQERGIELGPELLNYIMLRSERSMKSLNKVLNILDTLSLIEKRKITIPFVRERMGW